MTIKTEIEIEVMPCPFCGNDNNLFLESTGEENPFYFIECRNCYAQGPQHFLDKQDAVEKWNERK